MSISIKNRPRKWQFNALWSLIFTIYWPKILLWTLPNMSGVISSLFGIFRLLQMAPDCLKVMKNIRCPDFILVFWTSVALFLVSIGINTYIDQSSIWLEHECKISCLLSLCTVGQMVLDSQKWIKKHGNSDSILVFGLLQPYSLNLLT